MAFAKDKEKERFYLLPGQGGAAYRRKQRTFLNYSLVAAVLVCIVLAVALYWLNLRRP